MRRREGSWRNADKRLQRRGMTLIYKWLNVPNINFDIGSEIARHSHGRVVWRARDNLLNGDCNEVNHREILQIVDRYIHCGGGGGGGSTRETLI